MRVPNPRLVRLAGLTRGAKMEHGDGELVIPAVLQPLAKIPSPLPRFVGAGLTFSDSFCTSFANAIGGAQAGATQGIATISKGLWSINWWFDAMFLGTTGVGGTSLQWVDHLLDTVNIKMMRHFNGHQISDNGEFTVLVQEDGWHFDQVLGATVVGDFLSFDATILGQRLL